MSELGAKCCDEMRKGSTWSETGAVRPCDVHVRPGRVTPREAHDGGGRCCKEEQRRLFFRAPSFRRRRSGGTSGTNRTNGTAALAPQHEVRRAENKVVVIAQKTPHLASGREPKLTDKLGEPEGAGLERGTLRERSRSRRHINVDRVEADREAQALRCARPTLQRLEPRKSFRCSAALLEARARARPSCTCAFPSARSSATCPAASNRFARRRDSGRRGVGKGAQPLVLSEERTEDDTAEKAPQDGVVEVGHDGIGHVQAHIRLEQRDTRGARGDAAEIGVTVTARRAACERRAGARRDDAAPRCGEIRRVRCAPGNPRPALSGGENDRSLVVFKC